MRQNLTTLECRQSSERSSVEPRVLEAETAVHTVRGELQSHLLDVPLEKLSLCGFTVLHQALYLSTPVDEGRNKAREYTLADRRPRNFRDFLLTVLQRNEYQRLYRRSQSSAPRLLQARQW